MSKQALHLAELIKLLPVEEQLLLIELLKKQMKEQLDVKPKAGFIEKGTFVMSDDFNEPLEDFKEYM